ncbi:MAG: nitroreductase family protein [Bacteroidales bacterium]|jgi:nitroreductase|nr:nitroreductase family protein [Bacteroidales bacterium]
MNETIKTLLGHRSIRRYSSKNIDDDVLEQILMAAIRGSTTGNIQPYSIIINRDQAMKDKIAPLHFNQKAVIEAPVVLTFCVDYNRFLQWCKQRDADTDGFNNMQCFSWGIIDAVIATQNACIAAESLGLGICYMGTVTYHAKELSDIYKLPKNVVPVTCITLGYPAENPNLTDRLPLDAVIHHEFYHDYSPDDINELYAEKENLELTKKLLEENQLDNLAKVFTQKRYTKHDNEYFAKRFVDFIKEQNFVGDEINMLD